MVFHCQDTEPDHVEMDENNLFSDDNEEEDDDEPAQACRFGVTVSKQGKTVVLQCRAGVDSLHVDGVTVRDGDTESVLASLANGEGTHASLYQVSPRRSEIDHSLPRLKCFLSGARLR